MTKIEFHEKCIDLLTAIDYFTARREQTRFYSYRLTQNGLNGSKSDHDSDIADRAAKRLTKCYIKFVNNHLKSMKA
jgi:hypothetical protein